MKVRFAIQEIRGDMIKVYPVRDEFLIPTPKGVENLKNCTLNFDISINNLEIEESWDEPHKK